MQDLLKYAGSVERTISAVPPGVAKGNGSQDRACEKAAKSGSASPVLGAGAGLWRPRAQRTLASLCQAYEIVSAESICPSAFYDRFSATLVAFLKECLAHGLEGLAREASVTLSEKLAGFRDLVIADGTLVACTTAWPARSRVLRTRRS